mmetsp:Transcript_6057/g.15438  ORF Transcript_6057/g.15438 Transcript_6057/m.15438 type:complete len:90 (+) Transcript_6057:2402-2671(+)
MEAMFQHGFRLHAEYVYTPAMGTAPLRCAKTMEGAQQRPLMVDQRLLHFVIGEDPLGDCSPTNRCVIDGHIRRVQKCGTKRKRKPALKA